MSVFRNKFAKLLMAFALVLAGSVFTNITVASQPTYAANCPNGQFLNFRPWWFGLRDDATCELKNPSTKIDASGNVAIGTGGQITLTHFIWKIVFNAMDMLLNLIAYAAVVFVLIGGFHMLTSSGDPGKIAKGKQTISYALLGTVIAIIAGGLVRFVNDALIGSGSHDLKITSAGTITGGYTADTNATWLSATSAFLMIAGIGAVLMVVWGGVKLSMSAGDPTATIKAKNTIIFALIGAVIMIAASLIVRIVVGGVTGTMQ